MDKNELASVMVVGIDCLEWWYIQLPCDNGHDFNKCSVCCLDKIATGLLIFIWYIRLRVLIELKFIKFKVGTYNN